MGTTPLTGSASGAPTPAAIIITATPLVNFLITWKGGRKLELTAMFSLLLLLSGVTIARWGSSFNPTGFAWIILATVCNGLLYELFDRAKADPYQRCFWGSIGIGTIGLIGGVHHSWTPLIQHPVLWLVLGGFAFVHGFLYWMSNLMAFKLLPNKDVVSVLAQGETPVVIIMAYVLLGETLTLMQWVGVSVALIGSCRLLHWVKTTTSTDNAVEI